MPIEAKNQKQRRRLRLGMVGGGPGAFIGAVHRVAARLDDRYELVAAALSSDTERNLTSAQELHIPRGYRNFEEMALAESKRPDGIEVVSIVTPNHLHHVIAKTFLEAGIHVICDKPVTTTLEDARDLAETVKRTGLVFGLTHNYTAYPMMRQARAMTLAGELGSIRIVQVEYPQDWLSTALENTGQKQAEWRTDPARSGPGGCLGDIATHAFNLACFVTGLPCEKVSADVTTFVPGRRLDDNVQVNAPVRKGSKRGALGQSRLRAMKTISSYECTERRLALNRIQRIRTKSGLRPWENPDGRFGAGERARCQLPVTQPVYPRATQKGISNHSRNSTPTSRSKSLQNKRVEIRTPNRFSSRALWMASTDSDSSLPCSRLPVISRFGLRFLARK